MEPEGVLKVAARLYKENDTLRALNLYNEFSTVNLRRQRGRYLAIFPRRSSPRTHKSRGSADPLYSLPTDAERSTGRTTRSTYCSELDGRTRLELIRALEAEQGFAMRPFPRGRKGLTLAANGKLNPAGEGYLNMVISEGLCVKPGDRVVLTDIKFDHSKIVFDLNGGPDLKHRFLRHIQIGMGPSMNPVSN